MTVGTAAERGIEGIYQGDGFHWVGDGFRVTNYFPSGNDFGNRMSPYVLLDYHAPFRYAPEAGAKRGVGVHPHRGFETVTLAFEGSVAHHDSGGNSGVIGPGDVQWMTAASGVLHKEYHAEEFSRQGGVMHMAQIWVNLPRAHKMDAPAYQALGADSMGLVNLPDGAGQVRVIAGEWGGVKGPARTFSPLEMLDVRLHSEGRVPLSFPAKHNLGLLVLGGEIVINDEAKATALDFVLFADGGGQIRIKAGREAHLLILGGEPIDEPVVQRGPFVMNTQQEIRQAMIDLQDGKFGRLDD